MTTAHLICEDFFNSGIRVRRLNQDAFYMAEVVMINEKWNIAILKIYTKKTLYGELSSNSNLAAEQPLLYIGYLRYCIGCCRYGNVSFPCVNNV